MERIHLFPYLPPLPSRVVGKVQKLVFLKSPIVGEDLTSTFWKDLHLSLNLTASSKEVLFVTDKEIVA